MAVTTNERTNEHRNSPSIGLRQEPGRVHAFDAGDLSCGTGLAREFRVQILAIPVGDLLEVQTIDPAAKEDLAPLARLMGHSVRWIESSGDGRLLIGVERGR